MSTVAGAREFGHDARYLRPDESRPLTRRRARRGWRRLAAHAIRSAVAVGLIVVGREAALQIATSRAFELRHVVVEGCVRSNPEDLRSLVRQAAGRNLFDLDLAAVRRLAESSPWVRRADVRRRLPDTIALAIDEREPAAVALLLGRPMLVDEEGVVLAECGTLNERCDFPVLTGLDMVPLAERPSRIAIGVAAFRAVERQAPSLGRKLSEVDLSRPDRVAVLRVEGGPPILLSPDEAGRNLSNFLSVEDEINRRFARLEYVDLRFRGRIAVMPREPAAQAQGSSTRR